MDSIRIREIEVRVSIPEPWGSPRLCARSVVLNLFGKLPFFMNFKTKLPTKIFLKTHIFTLCSLMWRLSISMVSIFSTESVKYFMDFFRNLSKNLIRLPFFKFSYSPKRIIYPRIRSTALDHPPALSAFLFSSWATFREESTTITILLVSHKIFQMN